jgi:arsenate reductase
MKSILIICTGNSCRSQMAHGWLSHLTNDFCIYSAGTYPELVNKHAIKVMLEVGIDISKYSSNHLNEYIDIDIDFVLTVCDNANEKCPIFPSATSVIHKSFKDPADATGTYSEIINQYSSVRDELKNYIKDTFLEIISSNK